MAITHATIENNTAKVDAAFAYIKSNDTEKLYWYDSKVSISHVNFTNNAAYEGKVGLLYFSNEHTDFEILNSIFD